MTVQIIQEKYYEYLAISLNLGDLKSTKCESYIFLAASRPRHVPAQQGEEFGQHHRRRPPDLVIADGADAKERNRDRTLVADAVDRRESRRLEQLIQGDVENPRHLGVRRRPTRTRPDLGADGAE